MPSRLPDDARRDRLTEAVPSPPVPWIGAPAAPTPKSTEVRTMRLHRRWFPTSLLLLLIVTLTVPALAQTSTATIRGTVTDEDGEPIEQAEVNAVGSETGFVKTARSRADGAFVLAGLNPGPYTIVVSSEAYEPRSRDLTLQVGQTVNLTFRLTPGEVFTEEINVVGDVPIELETHEISTVVTPRQIENLPQNNRNFMNFAALAPGVTVSDAEFRKTFQAGAQSANAVNVFLDGVSLKNDVIQGGVVGQDSSRGNPFPQNSVQEFRVLTQNYAAEYQKASSAIISAVTKSGTNSLAGEVFAFFQDNDLVEDHPITGTDERFFERLQTGASVGGPIIQDRMHYFVGYEGNDQDRSEIVTLGPGGTPELRQQLSVHEGTFPSKFEETLAFGKLSYQADQSQLWDFSAFLRDEEDVRSFGNRQAFEHAEQVNNDVTQLAVRHQLVRNSWFNEASLSSQDYEWNPTPFNDIVGRDYQDVLLVGGFASEQDISQERISLRDDFTFWPIEWHGSHVAKAGALVDRADYELVKCNNCNPVFIFRGAQNWAFPAEAVWGLGDPAISADNTAYGLYLQDEWRPTDRLTLNVGLRWDYESNMFPADYVTPQAIRDAFGGSFVESDRFFTDGNDRSAIDDMFAPRVGFSYDVTGAGETVVFGGAGRYYDRTLFNNSLDERFRQQFNRGVFLFSADGQPLPDGRLTVAWDDRYLSRAGLLELLASGQTGRPEVFLIENDTEAPYSDQWTLGLRHTFGSIIGAVSYASVRSYNGFTFGWGHRNPDGTCCRWGEVNDLGYAALITSQDDIRTWYDAIYLTLDRPFTDRWGAQLAYTYSDTAESIGGDLFSFDFPTVRDYPRRPLNDVQDHRLVANGLVALPANFYAGTVVTYGSGLRYNIIDRSQGGGIAERILRGGGEGSSYLTIDLRLEYRFDVGPIGISLLGEAFNVTNDEVESQWENVIPTLPTVNPKFGEATQVVAGSQRRLQYGVRLTF
jgi:outer membrane receptor protein involved in Fe transport